MPQKGLKRELSLFTLIAISAGATLGGWLAELPYWFELTGSGAGFLFPVLALLLLPVGLAFAELTSMMPFTSSVDAWTASAINHGTAWATQWAFFLVQVVEPPLVAFIYVTVARYFIDMSDALASLLAIGVMFIWYIISNFRIQLAGRLAVIFFVSMLTVTMSVSIYLFFFSGHWEWTNISNHGGIFPFGITGAATGAAALVLKYIGFGLTPTLIQETTFPAKKMVWVIVSALFIPAIVYFIATFAISGLAPHGVIASTSMPVPELVESLNMPWTIAILAIIAGLLYAFTTLMGFWSSSARALYGASQLNQLPDWFLKTNRYGQPYISNLVILAFGIFFAMFTGSNWVEYVYSISVVSAGVVYFMVCLVAYILRNKHPEWERPYKARWGKLIFLIGMFVSLYVLVVGVTQLPLNAAFPLIVYIMIGILIYFSMKIYRKHSKKDYTLITLTPAYKDEID